MEYFQHNQFYKMNPFLFCLKLCSSSPQCCQERQKLLSSHRELTKTICSELKDTVEVEALQASTHSQNLWDVWDLQLGAPFKVLPSTPLQHLCCSCPLQTPLSVHQAVSPPPPRSCPLQTPPWKCPPKISPSLGLFQTMTLGHLRPGSCICHVLPLVSSWVPPRSTLLSLNLALLFWFD